MAMIAPVLNFFLEPPLGFGGTVGEGEGEGVGGIEEHWLSGSPHNIKFPSKDDGGNFCRAKGIEPFRWLKLKFNCISLGRLR
jgi:hypothetical protein